MTRLLLRNYALTLATRSWELGRPPVVRRQGELPFFLRSPSLRLPATNWVRGINTVTRGDGVSRLGRCLVLAAILHAVTCRALLASTYKVLTWMPSKKASPEKLS